MRRWNGLFCLLVLVFCIGGCAGPPVEPLMPTPVLFSELSLSPLDNIPEDRRWKPRRVYYATTRERESSLQRIDYSNRESEVISAGMTLIGFGGDNLTWSDLSEYSRLEERPDVVDLSIAGLLEAGTFKPSLDTPVSEQAAEGLAFLVNDLNRAIDDAPDQDLLVYVHGAKVNFYNANVFAAQLDHFMGREMTSVAFSWPTRQNIVSYGSGGDVRRAYRAAPALASLLEVLAARTVARRIHIVCWSAGGRVVTEALEILHNRNDTLGVSPRDRFRLGTVYYAAADVPTQIFLEALPEINALAQRVVVTMSSRDGALNMAEKFMGGGARIGQRNQRQLADADWQALLAADRLEIVDVSRNWEGRGFDITGHRYWFNHPWASSDLVLAVRSDFGPEERGLVPTESSILWAIPADYPARLRSLLTQEGLKLRKTNP